MDRRPKRERSQDDLKYTASAAKKGKTDPPLTENDDTSKEEPTVFQLGIANKMHNNRKSRRSGTHKKKSDRPVSSGTQTLTNTNTTTTTTTTSLADSGGSPGPVSAADVTVASDALITPTQTRTDSDKLQSASHSIISSTGSRPNVESPGPRVKLFEAESEVTLDFKLDYGEYVLKIEKRRRISSSSSSSTHNENNKKEEAKQLAHHADLHAGMLLQAEMLRNMGEQLLSKYRASLQVISEK